MALVWSGQIASTADTGVSYGMNGEIHVTVSRSNNTVTYSSFYVRHQTQSSGAWWDYEWQTDGYINGSLRLNNAQTKGRTGTTTIGQTWYSSGTASYAVGVGTGSGSKAVSANWKCNAYGDVSSQKSVNVSYPAAGSPAGTSTLQSGTDTDSIYIRNNVTSWGAYCTAGSVRSYIANNSGFSGQTYIGTTDNAQVHHSGLTSNDEYWLRGWCNNGAGLSTYMNTVSTVTLPKAPVLGTAVPLATTCDIPTTLDTGGGRYTITEKYRIRESGGTWGSWTTYTGNTINATGLNPVQEYEVQTQSVTTAGTTDGGTVLFTTLPAAKLKYSGGSVVNAIPRIVETGETTVMANVNIVDPA